MQSSLDVPTIATRRLHACHHARAPSGGRWNYGREISGNFAEMTISTPFRDLLHAAATTWDRRLYFPFEGRRAEDFLRPKNPTASAGCEPVNLGTKGQHAISRPPKPLYTHLSMTRNRSDFTAIFAGFKNQRVLQAADIVSVLNVYGSSCVWFIQTSTTMFSSASSE